MIKNDRKELFRCCLGLGDERFIKQEMYVFIFENKNTTFYRPTALDAGLYDFFEFNKNHTEDFGRTKIIENYIERKSGFAEIIGKHNEVTIGDLHKCFIIS